MLKVCHWLTMHIAPDEIVNESRLVAFDESTKINYIGAKTPITHMSQEEMP